MPDIDWEALRRTAVDAMGRAYAPYSKYPVGAAAVTDDGRVPVTGAHRVVGRQGVAGPRGGRPRDRPAGRFIQRLYDDYRGG